MVLCESGEGGSHRYPSVAADDGVYESFHIFSHLFHMFFHIFVTFLGCSIWVQIIIVKTYVFEKVLFFLHGIHSVFSNGGDYLSFFARVNFKSCGFVREW